MKNIMIQSNKFKISSILLLTTLSFSNVWAGISRLSNSIQSNSTYTISKQLDLGSDTLKLPSNVTLSFGTNGFVKNGVIVGNNTKIQAGNKKIFNRTIGIAGTWNVAKATSDWFECAKNGYSINYKTFSEYTIDGAANQIGYKFADKIYKAGTSPNVKYTDDTYPLNQLLNLKATHTVITAGNYMVKPTYGDVSKTNFNDPNQGLCIRDAHNRILEINGTLKTIPTDNQKYTLLAVYKSDNFTLTGTGKLEGDIYEHPANKGEWGFLFFGSGLTNFNLKNLTFEGAWGDGVYISWSKINANENVQRNHVIDNIKVNNCRRTGLVYELGDTVLIKNSQFDGHKNRRGTATYSGIDIEPFGTAKIKYCHNVNVLNCTFKNYKKGSGVRYERVIGGSVINCKFEVNSTDITLGRCFTLYKDVEMKKNRPYSYYTYIEITGNTSNKSSSFLRTIDDRTALYNSNALVYGNVINNPQKQGFDGVWKTLEFFDNTINTANNFGGNVHGASVKMYNNTFNNVKTIFNIPKADMIKRQVPNSEIKLVNDTTKFEFRNNK